jgi:tetratricopeptide (TPR) repeat protein
MRVRPHRLFLAASAALLVASAAGAQPILPAPKGPATGGKVDEQAELQKGQYAYVRALKIRAADPSGALRDFGEADAAFQRMLDPQTGTLHDKLFIVEARMYEGATLVALGRKEEAAAQFEKILEADGNYAPDPVVFPVAVGTVFIDAKSAYLTKLKELEAERREREKRQREREEAAKKAQIERTRQLEVLVTQEHVVDHHSRWIALLPFGVGQLQNGKTGLGYFFLTTESVLLAGGVVTVPIYYAQLSTVSSVFTGPQESALAQAYLDRANEARIVNLVFYGALAFTAVAGVIEAEASYVPDVSSIKPRKLPDLPGVSPDAAPPPKSLSLTFGAAPIFGGEAKGGISGGVLGVGGRF